MDAKINVINSISKNNILIQNIIKKYSNNINIKLTGKSLHYLSNTTILQFYCLINRSTEINPFSSEINLSFEFIDNSGPYVQILNDFINPTLNDGRNIFCCLTNKHQYVFKKNESKEFEIMFDEMINGIKDFLLCLKENIQINAYVYYGEYIKGYFYQINDFIINKNTIKFFRIIEIKSKNEEMKYIIITQLYFLVLEPADNDMSFSKLEQCFFLKDIDFSLEEETIKKRNKKTYNLKILNKEINIIYEIEFFLYKDDNKENNNDISNNNYIEFQNILVTKKNEIDLQKYKIVITNYKPLFTIEIKKNNKNKKKLMENMYNDYKLYIAYFEELFNYYKDFKEENIKKRVKTYLSNLTYYCVDFISFYDSNAEEVKLYQSKMIKYLNNKEI